MRPRARTRGRGGACVLWLAATVGLAACGEPHAGSAMTPPGQDGEVHDTAAVVRQQADEARLARLEPGALATVAAVPVRGWTGPGGRPFEVAVRTRDPQSAHARPFGTITLGTALRKRSPNLGQYPCTACHLGRRIEMRGERIADAHRNIQPEHPRLLGATCATCHSRDNVEMLALENGERETLEHTYRLCAQCHFDKARAWAGGGHGKRLDGWQGRRVVMGCADCHDPHRPAIETRIPFRAPRLERPGRRDD